MDKGKTDKIAALGGLCGITPEYVDNYGERHHTSRATYEALLTAMGVPWEDPEGLEAEIARRRLGPWDSLLEPVQVVWAADGPLETWLRLWSPAPESPPALEVHGELSREDGSGLTWNGVLTQPDIQEIHPVPTGFRLKLALPLPGELEWGYYDLALEVKAGHCREAGQTRLIVAPRRAYCPAGSAGSPRLWGFNVPLYALKGAGDWGMGDFGDLQTLMGWAGTLGAAFVGVNPLHAPAGNPAADPSPYSPSSRVYRNFLYLNLEEVPELANSAAAQALLNGTEFRRTRARLQEAPLVPYGEVYQLKRRFLKLLYQAFEARHGPPETPGTSRGREFAAFLAEGGDSLRRFGEFGALADFFHADDWRRWPDTYQHPDNSAVADFARTHPGEVHLHQYAQWLTAGQLQQVYAQAREQELPFTLYEDLALGSRTGGFDTWAHRDCFALEAAIGAPADHFNPRGQNWGLPPLIPDRLRRSGYRLFIDTLRANLPPGGMLRLDHVMGLFRLFWIPAGKEVDHGAYVKYPARELLAVLALESAKRRAVVIGEDLGTVPAYVRAELAQTGILSYRVFYFERDQDHRFQRPEDYPVLAMATVTTHDLPTLTGYCAGRDLALREALDLYASPQLAQMEAEARQRDRRALAETLAQRGLLPAGGEGGEGGENPPAAGESCPRELRGAVLEYLAQSEAAFLEVRLEEIFGVAEQQNLPGSGDEHPNWRQKLPLTLEAMIRAPEAAEMAARLNKYRGRKKRGAPD